MNTIEANGELLLPCPDGFAPMTAEELDRVYTCDDPRRSGMWDKERHVIISVLWQRYFALLTWFADMKALAKRNEQLTRKGYQGHDYQLDGFFSRKVCGLSGEGYRFTYRLGDLTQEIETVLVKKGGTVYSINCIGRPEQREANRALFDMVLDNIRLK